MKWQQVGLAELAIRHVPFVLDHADLFLCEDKVCEELALRRLKSQ